MLGPGEIAHPLHLALEVALPVTLFVYVAAWALSLATLGRGGERTARWARVALIAGFVAHTVDIGARCVVGIHPVASAQEATSFAAWVVIAAYLVASRKGRLDTAGAFVTPVAVILLIVARVRPAAGAASLSLGILGRVHVSLATIGVALFALAAGFALIYLLEDSQLREKRFGALFRKGPPLARLDQYGNLCVSIGFPIFTVALITGAVWVMRLPRAAESVRPEYVLAVVTWIAFAALLIARRTAGWRGRRAAFLTLIGFGASLAVLALYLARSALGVG